MNITLRLEGIPEDIIDEMLKAGIAASKTEAIRIALLDYNEHHPLKKIGKPKRGEDEEYGKLQFSGWKEYLADEKEDAVWNKYL